MKINLDQIKDMKNLHLDVPMKEYTSFKAGGHADGLVEPASLEDLKECISQLKEKGIPFMVMGNGSNILVRDGGFRGVMVKIGDSFNEITVDGERLTAGSGALLSTIARSALANQLTGFEFAGGIPGSMGGAVFMNAGAYGGEICDVLEEGLIFSPETMEVKKVKADYFNLGYRSSFLQQSGEILISATLKLSKGDKDQIAATMKDLTDKRNSKQPVNYPSGGSFFKRPTGYFAGKLIDDSGLRGLTVGGAQVSELHCGFIINRDNATATDIISLMKIVQSTVMDKEGVKLEPEVRIIGEDSCTR